ncbi:hypothetical protein BG004_007051 [Podila humilis]|nr:hypothetical protein BG004_007051 [Podila humilis]
MTDTGLLKLFCVVNGESTPFPGKNKLTETVGDLKDAIKAKKPNDFGDIDADQLTLWRICIPVFDDDKHYYDSGDVPILVENVNSFDKIKLNPVTRLSDVSEEIMPGETIHIVIQRPSQGSSGIGIVVKPDKEVLCTWSAAIDTVTMGELMKLLVRHYPQYDHDDYVDLHFYETCSSPPEHIRDHEHLRRILRFGKTKSMDKLILSLATPSKPYSAWTFKDVVSEYNLSERTDICIEILPEFTDIKAAPLVSEPEKRALRHLIQEVSFRVEALKPGGGANEATKSMPRRYFRKTCILLRNDTSAAVEGMDQSIFQCIHQEHTLLRLV